MEELLGHPWIARHRLQAAQPAASDAVSMHTVPAVARQESRRKQMPKEEVKASKPGSVARAVAPMRPPKAAVLAELIDWEEENHY